MIACYIYSSKIFYFLVNFNKIFLFHFHHQVNKPSGTGLPMIALIVMCFVGCDQVFAMIVLCMAVGFNGATYSGYMCSHADLAPAYAGTLMGITNTIATIPGFAAPAIVGAIINNNVSIYI